jgi:hypothetical protein
MRRNRRGSELIEFAFAMPVLCTLLFGILEYGTLFNQMLVLQGAARDGARWAATPGIPFDEAIDEARGGVIRALELHGITCGDAEQAAGTCTINAEIELINGYSAIMVDSRLRYNPIAGDLLPTPDDLQATSVFILINQPVP